MYKFFFYLLLLLIVPIPLDVKYDGPILVLHAGSIMTYVGVNFVKYLSRDV